MIVVESSDALGHVFMFFPYEYIHIQISHEFGEFQLIVWLELPKHHDKQQTYTCTVYIYISICVCDGMWLYLKIVYITKLTLEQNK